MLIKFCSRLITQPHTFLVLPHLPTPAAISHIRQGEKDTREMIIWTSVVMGGKWVLSPLISISSTNRSARVLSLCLWWRRYRLIHLPSWLYHVKQLFVFLFFPSGLLNSFVPQANFSNRSNSPLLKAPCVSLHMLVWSSLSCLGTDVKRSHKK